MNLTLDQHRLCVDKDGIVVLGEDGLTVFDTLSKGFVVVPHAQANEAIAFLSQVEAVTVMPESTVPQDIKFGLQNRLENVK